MSIHYNPDEDFKVDGRNRNLRTLDYTKYARGIRLFNPDERIIELSMLKTSADIGRMATFDTVKAVYRFNPDAIVAFTWGDWLDLKEDAPVGLLAHLPLNRFGARALFSGELDTAAPGLHVLARQNERPAAIYFWFVHLPQGVGGGLSLAMERMTSDRYRGLPIFCKAANAKAEAFFETLGFVKGASFDGISSKEIMTCDLPDAASRRKPYDSYIPGAAAGTKRTSVTVVRSLDDILKCIAVRGAAYVEDRSIPYAEDVDGNDFTATHLLGYVGDEPAGCIRLRYFADFIKIERLAVYPRFRGKLANDLIKAAIAFGRDKGYRRFYGQSASHVAKLWKHFGFEQRQGDGIEYLTDEVYYEMDLVCDPAAEPLTPNSGAAVLVRPEGQWDRPGPLEALKHRDDSLRLTMMYQTH
jgi:GNAT superfamily N-acetyltransferase